MVCTSGIGSLWTRKFYLNTKILVMMLQILSMNNLWQLLKYFHSGIPGIQGT